MATAEQTSATSGDPISVTLGAEDWGRVIGELQTRAREFRGEERDPRLNELGRARIKKHADDLFVLVGKLQGEIGRLQQ